MPIGVTDPATGERHEFPDGTPTASIQAEMQRRKAAAQQQTQPQPTPLQQPGMQPRGFVPGPATAKSSSLLEQEMPDLSADAQRGLRMVVGGGAEGDKTMEQAGRILLEKDPSYQIRKKAMEGQGEAVTKRNEARLAGENMIGSYAKLYHNWMNTPDELLAAATGPRNMAEVAEKTPTYLWGTNLPIYGMEKPTTRDPVTDAPIMGPMTTLRREAILNPNDEALKEAHNKQTLFTHDTEGLTNAFVSNAPKGMNMSNDRQKLFSGAMKDFLHAGDRKGQAKVLEHALSIIQNDFNLTPPEAQHVLQTHLRRLALDEHQKVVQRSEQVPHNAILDLMANPTAKNIKYFNEIFNNKERGLAEYVIHTSAASPEVDSPAPPSQQGPSPSEQLGRRSFASPRLAP